MENYHILTEGKYIGFANIIITLSIFIYTKIPFMKYGISDQQMSLRK